MDTTLPVRVVLFWDSEHARDAYGPYFIGVAKKTWTFTQMVIHDQLIRKILKHQGMDLNLWRVRITMRIFSDVQHTHVSTNKDHSNIRQHVTAITQIVSDKPSILYIDIEEDDEDDDNANEDYDVLSASDDNNDDNDEEDDINTPVNPLSSTTMN
ncbi:hypothetical protein M9H77_08265 [Catharanthus roseus]|uniref:Uncharacterized protein n=1 Tax=Catharanthus roseus TaxID=4058 RepID=A0ACC0BXC3_CATRO|nr:hypothetical protein M9H77_08265 [Catharanthus roseus]